MTATTAINSTAAANTGTNKAKSNTLGKNEFFKILAAQLQNQDPINPASNTEFVAQLAQFSSLEQLQTIATSISSMSIMQSAGLIGKTAVVESNGTSITGKVESIMIQDSVPYAVINGNYLPVSLITQISQGDE
jgi:flagellar basal-body rod modification protein FlgD